MKDGIKIIGMEETMAVLDQIREDFPRKVAVSAIKNRPGYGRFFIFG